MAVGKRSLEGLVSRVPSKAPFDGLYAGRRVFVTGHTGFKGAWLVAWLLELGANVVGYSLEPPTAPSLFAELGLADHIEHNIGDIRDLGRLSGTMSRSEPEIVIHLAAQPLVRRSYENPVETFETNVMGSVNVLEAARGVPSIRAILNVTSDKCYENREWEFAYRENDSLGGRDPYSASKGAAEIVTAAYGRSFFASGDAAAVATARAGNVIGGGDWAEDRIVPDCARALSSNRPVVIRNRDAVRPWQHVLEPLSGYLLLAAKQYSVGADFAGAWNFGPGSSDHLTVGEIADQFVARWGSGGWEATDSVGDPHEARFLKLDCSKAADVLAWRPTWDASLAISEAASWYRAFYEGADARELVAGCLRRYVGAATDAGTAAWTRSAS